MKKIENIEKRNRNNFHKFVSWAWKTTVKQWAENKILFCVKGVVIIGSATGVISYVSPSIISYGNKLIQDFKTSPARPALPSEAPSTPSVPSAPETPRDSEETLAKILMEFSRTIWKYFNKKE